MTDKEMFEQILKNATNNLTDTPPTNPKEFDVYCDTHYNLHMFIKGEWTSVGINVTPI